MYQTKELFQLEQSLAGDYLAQFCCPWEALRGIRDCILAIGQTLDADYSQICEGVWVHRSAVIAPTAYIGAPCILGAETEVRHCAYIRGAALVGEHCVVGNSVELKNVILFNHVQVPHYNYVGDSILGYYAHMGAGSITSNVKSDHSLVVVHEGDAHVETGLKKFGAMLGDYAEIGCNSVLNPGTIVGRHSNVYPLSSVRGIVPEHSIYKAKGQIIKKR